MNKKRILPLAILLLCVVRLAAQMDAYNSQYLFNKLVLNPAYAGSSGELSARLQARWQWAGFANSPRTQTLSLHMPTPDQHHGFGMNLVSDQLGHTRSVLFNLNYAYRIAIGTGHLGLGLDFGLRQFAVDFSDITFLGDVDPLIPAGRNTLTNVVVGPGAYYQNSIFYAGVSMPNLLPQKLGGLYAVPQSTAKTPANLYLMGGAAIPAGLMVKIRPSVLVRFTGGLPVGLDLGLAAMFKDRILAGVVWKPANALVFQMQAYLTPKLQIGYAYDLTLKDISGYSSGSHEVLLGVDLNVHKASLDAPVRF